MFLFIERVCTSQRSKPFVMSSLDAGFFIFGFTLIGIFFSFWIVLLGFFYAGGCMKDRGKGERDLETDLRGRLVEAPVRGTGGI